MHQNLTHCLCHNLSEVSEACQVKPSITGNMNLVLAEIMQDTKLYPWTSVRPCHAILLQQTELGHSTWASEAEYQRLCCSHIWNVVSANATTPIPHSPPLTWQGERSAQRVEADPGTKACAAFNNSSCYKQEEHPKCFTSANTACQRSIEHVSMLNE